jgi:thioesterase domain-containing protein
LIGEMATSYASSVVAAVDGPFVIGGNSFGAMVAYEMACQLEASGHRPSNVVLVDPRVSGASRGWLVPRLWRYQVKLRRRLARGWRRIRRSSAGPARPEQPASIHAARAEHSELRSTFEPTPYHGDVTLVATRDHRMLYGRDSALSGLVAGEMTIVPLGGLHAGALRGDRLPIVAEAVNEVLRRSQSAKQGGSATVSARDS